MRYGEKDEEGREKDEEGRGKKFRADLFLVRLRGLDWSGISMGEAGLTALLKKILKRALCTIFIQQNIN